MGRRKKRKTFTDIPDLKALSGKILVVLMDSKTPKDIAALFPKYSRKDLRQAIQRLRSVGYEIFESQKSKEIECHLGNNHLLPKRLRNFTYE